MEFFGKMSPGSLLGNEEGKSLHLIKEGDRNMDVFNPGSGMIRRPNYIRKGTRYRPLVYVASPFSGDVERNVMNARRYCRFVVESGAVPLAPHLLLPQFMSENAERCAAMLMNQEFLSRCDELWMFGDVITSGMAWEWVWARQRGIPIRFFTTGCKEKTTGKRKKQNRLNRQVQGAPGRSGYHGGN